MSTGYASYQQFKKQLTDETWKNIRRELQQLLDYLNHILFDRKWFLIENADPGEDEAAIRVPNFVLRERVSDGNPCELWIHLSIRKGLGYIVITAVRSNDRSVRLTKSIFMSDQRKLNLEMKNFLTIYSAQLMRFLYNAPGGGYNEKF